MKSDFLKKLYTEVKVRKCGEIKYGSNNGSTLYR